MTKQAHFFARMILIGLAFVTSSCGLFDPDEEKPGKQVPLNPKLKRVLYIGNVDPKNSLPNQGQPFGHVQLPVWASASRLYVNTWEAKNDVVRRGLFEIEIDENTRAFKSYAVFEFPYYIRSAGFDRSANKVFIIYVDQIQSKAAYVSFANNNTVIDEELVGAEWSPWGMTAWEGKPGFIFYGENPNNGTQGFYWRYRDGQGSVRDSLLYAITLDQFSAAEFSTSYDGRLLFFGMNAGSQNDHRVQFLKLDITRPAQNPVVIAERKEGYLAIRANPVDTQLVLLNYGFGGDAVNPPQAHLELLNVTTLRGVDLDVRTNPMLYFWTLNQNPFWSPDGKHFAFSAGGAAGEGERLPLEIWIYENVP